MNEERFASKVEYEGGIFDALDYGLRSTDLDDQDSDLAVAWEALEKAFDNMRPALAEVERILEDLW